MSWYNLTSSQLRRKHSFRHAHPITRVLRYVGWKWGTWGNMRFCYVETGGSLLWRCLITESPLLRSKAAKSCEIVILSCTATPGKNLSICPLVFGDTSRLHQTRAENQSFQRIYIYICICKSIYIYSCLICLLEQCWTPRINCPPKKKYVWRAVACFVWKATTQARWKKCIYKFEGLRRQSLMPAHGFAIRIGALGSKIQILEDVSREAWNIKW